jgi:galactitol-specific phosphotransferase system IIB component
MLDRIAGTTSQAAAFGASLHTLRQMEQELADIATLGNEEERNEVQQMIQEVIQSHVCRLQ